MSEKEEIEKLLWRSSMELPYPLNYMRFEYPAMACFLVKMGDWVREHHR